MTFRLLAGARVSVLNSGNPAPRDQKPVVALDCVSADLRLILDCVDWNRDCLPSPCECSRVRAYAMSLTVGVSRARVCSDLPAQVRSSERSRAASPPRFEVVATGPEFWALRLRSSLPRP